LNYQNKHRIAAFDILRALAVLLMVEGHTVHVFLSSSLRNGSSIGFEIWKYLRGFTAPLFMFIAGAVFIYLLLADDETGYKPERLRKGLSRGVLLIFLGYLLRFPSFNLVRLLHVTDEQMKTFASVDALHIIGIGLILLSLIVLISARFKLNLIVIFVLSLSISGLLKFLLNDSSLILGFPLFVKAYFTNSFGSIFPLFPWLGYIFLGGLFGYLTKKKILTKTENLFVLSLSFLIFIVGLFNNLTSDDWLVVQATSIIVKMSGVVLLFIFIDIFTDKINRLPEILLLLGRNSLLIYVVHLVILYGSPISLGFYQIVPERFSLLLTIVFVLIMEMLMIFMARLKEKQSIKKNIYGLIKVYGKIT